MASCTPAGARPCAVARSFDVGKDWEYLCAVAKGTIVRLGEGEGGERMTTTNESQGR